MQFDGTSLTTTEPAPTITSSPILTPPNIIAPVPIEHLSPINTSRFRGNPLTRLLCSWLSIETPAEMVVLFPI
jgi:hypothetical protein